MPSILPGKKKILINASVIIAGLLSPSGGSAKILSICRIGEIIGFVSNAIFDEVKRNLPSSRPDVLQAFDVLHGSNALQVTNVRDEDLAPHVGLVNEKDVHVLAAAVNAGAELIVSLNRKHLVGNPHAEKALSLRIVTPKQLIQELAL